MPLGAQPKALYSDKKNMERTKWTDRRFSFDFPEGWMFTILERLRGTGARIVNLVDGLPEERLLLRPGGKWSIQEHIGHLSDLEFLHEGRLDDFLAGRDTLRAADMTNTLTESSRHNDKDLAALIQSFTVARTRFITKFENLPDGILYRKAMHPRLQVLMRPVDVAYFAAEHDDHHLASIHHIIIT